jgi:hypothetical protein
MEILMRSAVYNSAKFREYATIREKKKTEEQNATVY